VQGISFLNAMYNIFLKRELKEVPEIEKWLELLFSLVDICGDNPERHLKLFVLGKERVIKDYKNVSIKFVSTCSSR